ncbi:YceI family protein [Streptomyces sp. SCSIO ZS0520]|uniref:YceI family protein n=1 Tax=Streptomyces sp. SCSIO ZS0520 TaxID=2892996 RepID=UPI0021DB27CD|nr:YceI family protein [Streptomyces sp. SCSIO ZS0520]
MVTAGPEGQSDIEPGTYEIEPGASTVRFATRAMFGLVPVRGSFALREGRITVSEPVEESSVEVVIDAGGFDSGNRKRDEHVKSADYLDAAAHPGIAYRGTGVSRTAEGATLQGELTVKGVTRPVAVTVGAVAVEGRRLTARGTATVDRYAFDITTAKGMTGRRLTLTLDIVASR